MKKAAELRVLFPQVEKSIKDGYTSLLAGVEAILVNLSTIHADLELPSLTIIRNTDKIEEIIKDLDDMFVQWGNVSGKI